MPFVQSVIELFLAAESLSAKYLLDSLEEFEKCLSEVVECFDDLKMGDKECIKVRLKPYYQTRIIKICEIKIKYL